MWVGGEFKALQTHEGIVAWLHPNPQGLVVREGGREKRCPTSNTVHTQHTLIAVQLVITQHPYPAGSLCLTVQTNLVSNCLVRQTTRGRRKQRPISLIYLVHDFVFVCTGYLL